MIFGIDLVAQAHMDSMRHELEQASDPMVKLDLLKELAFSSIVLEPNDVKKYGEEYLAICDSLDLKSAKAAGLNIVGIAHHLRGDIFQSLDIFRDALRFSKTYGPENLVLPITNNIGLIYIDTEEDAKALDVFVDGYERAVANKDTANIPLFLTNISYIHERRGEYDEAIDYADQCLKVLESDFNFERGADMFRTAVLLTKASSLRKQEKYDKALSILDLVIKDANANNSLLDLAKAYSHKAEIAYLQGRYSASERLYKKGLSEINGTHFNREIVDCLKGLSRTQLAHGKYQEAVQSCDQAISQIDSIDMISERVALLDIKVKALHAIGNNEGTYRANRELVEWSNRDAEVKRESQLKNLGYIHKFESIQAERELLEAENVSNEAKLDYRYNLVVLVLSLIGLIFFTSLSYYFQSISKSKYREKLEESVSLRTNELAGLNSRLEYANRELENFAYITSHDLKEPLRNIGGFVGLLKTRAPKTIDASVREYFDIILANVRQMGDLIEDVLSFSTVHKDHMKLEKCNLAAIVRDKVSELDTLIKEKDAIVNIGDLPIIHSNRTQLQIVLKNLIENGLKYNDKDNPELDISYQTRDGHHEIAIKDNGMGVPVEHQKAIFEMFKRLHSRQEYSGTGLGLAICQKVISRFGGEIRLDSEPGLGSVFTIVLPDIAAPSSLKISDDEE